MSQHRYKERDYEASSHLCRHQQHEHPQRTTTYSNHTLPAETNKALGLLDFALHPHLDHAWFPQNTMANLEKLAATIFVPSYAIDDETAIKVIDGTLEIISEGQWKLFNPR